MFRILKVFVLATIPLAASADGRVPLWEDAELEYGLKLIAKAHVMRRKCDEISLRYWRGMGLFNSLVSRAKTLGYSEDEIRAYVDDKEQKARVEGIARRELEAQGVDYGEPDSFCRVAKVEIAADRDFGHYFRVR